MMMQVKYYTSSKSEKKENSLEVLCDPPRAELVSYVTLELKDISTLKPKKLPYISTSKLYSIKCITYL